MNWEAIGAIGEIVAAAAVIGSLLFVGSQLRQSRYIERANAQRDLLKQASEWMSSPSLDSDIFEAVRQCLEDFHGADPIVKDRFNGWAFRLLFIMEQAHYMRQDGLINDGSFDGFERAMLSIISARGGRQWWAHAYNVIGADVGEHLATRLAEVGDSVPPWDELLPHFGANS